MPIADTNQAAALTFDAAVNRALARRLSDTPYPHNGAHAASTAPLRGDGDAECSNHRHGRRGQSHPQEKSGQWGERTPVGSAQKRQHRVSVPGPGRR